MSSKKKGGLLNRVLGKGKEDEEGGAQKSKKGKKNKLEKQPSIRESVHSERPPTMHSATHHGSEAPLQYDEHHGAAPVTAVHEDDPYSPFDESASYMHMREPSTIHVRPESTAHHHNSAGYFDQPFSHSPGGTVVHSANVHENSVEHVETAHPNVISFGEQGHGHAQPDEHVAFAGVSRQPTILSPHHQGSEAPRMLKPGDRMEIDPRNPPTFVVDEGVTLEIGDEETGFVPYEQYLANLAKQPPPTTGGTYIVQGGGDVVIQDENGDVIKTISGTGANAGRGAPQIHHPPHIVPILVSLSRRATKPRYLSKQRNSQGKILIKKSPIKFSTDGGLRSILESVGFGSPFSSLLDLVDPLPRRQEVEFTEIPREFISEDPSATAEMAATEDKPPVPTRPLPPTPNTAVLELQPPTESHALVQATSMKEVYSEPPMASPASIEDFDELEDVDSDLALVGSTSDVAITPKMSLGKAITVETGDTLVTTTFSRAMEGRSPATPIEELSDMSEIILSPVRTRSLVSNAASSQSSPSRSDELENQQEALPAPWAAGGPRLYGFQGDFAVPTASINHERAASQDRNSVAISPTIARQASPTLTHSQAEDVAEDQEMPFSKPLPPPRPARSPNRPSPSPSRSDPLSSVPPLPLPPPLAILRQTHRNPVPIPASTFSTEKSTQPRLTPSPKILAMIQKFEGTTRESEDLGNTFIGSTRSLSVSPSRRGSVSSSKMENNYSSPWTSYNTPPSSRPDTPNSVSEFGEQIYPGGGPSNMEIARGMEVRWRGDGRTSDMVNQANWDLRPTTNRRGSMPATSRPSMTAAIPGWEVQPELIRELSLKRLRRAE